MNDAPEPVAEIKQEVKRLSWLKLILRWVKISVVMLFKTLDIIRKTISNILFFGIMALLLWLFYQGYQEYRKVRNFINQTENYADEYVDEYKAQMDRLQQEYQALKAELPVLEAQIGAQVADRIQQGKQLVEGHIQQGADTAEKKAQRLRDEIDSVREKLSRLKDR